MFTAGSRGGGGTGATQQGRSDAARRRAGGIARHALNERAWRHMHEQIFKAKSIGAVHVAM